MRDSRSRLLHQSQYDLRVATEFSQIREQVDHYFVDLDVPCPYGKAYTAVFHQALFAPLSSHAMEIFLASGYRRNGDCLYSMACKECSECLSIRLFPDDFIPNRSQKRNWRKNCDVETEMRPLGGIRHENVELCDSFLRERYPTDNSGEKYYREFFANKITTTYEVDFIVDGKLVGTSIIDVGENYVNAVYFYFSPEQAHRGLGTYNVLYLIDFCQKRDIKILYLGYYIRDCQAMNYKQNFRPHQLLIDGKWKQQRCT